MLNIETMNHDTMKLTIIASNDPSLQNKLSQLCVEYEDSRMRGKPNTATSEREIDAGKLSLLTAAVASMYIKMNAERNGRFPQPLFMAMVTEAIMLAIKKGEMLESGIRSKNNDASKN